MVQNAKDYNETSSDIYTDAERIRKSTHNFMKTNNPAYNDPDYKAAPTPVPEEPTGPRIRLNASLRASAATPSRQPATPKAKPAPEPEPEEMEVDPPAESEAAEAGEEDDTYKGLDFQKASEKLVEEMLTHQNDNGELDFESIFGNLPSRTLEDYYRTITQPQCLKKMSKLVKGWHSRQEQTGTTDFKTWDALEQEMAKIWNNARIYNEDGSDVFQAANELEEFFMERLALAKQHVREPQASIKLKTGGSKGGLLKLNLSQKQSPAPSASEKHASPAPKASIAPEQPAPFKVNGGPPTVSSVPNLAPGPTPLPNGIPSSVMPNGASMRPPSSSNGSPYPVQHPHAATTALANNFDTKWRIEGREVLIRNLHLESSESESKFKLTVPAHAKLAQQSVTVNLPAAQKALRVTLDLAPALQSKVGRPSKVFVTANGYRIAQRPDIYQVPNGDNKSPPPTFDLRLTPGMNRIEVECAAVSAPKNGNLRGELEMERIYIHAHSLKA